MFAIGIGEFTGVGQHATVVRREHFQRATAERLGLFAHSEQASGPVEQRMRIAGLGFDVDRQIAVLRVHDRR
ncbi:hypothetical protein D3C72_1334510 [compost metagenome]